MSTRKECSMQDTIVISIIGSIVLLFQIIGVIHDRKVSREEYKESERENE